MSFPKVVALDTDWTMFSGVLDINKIGKGRNQSALNPPENNLEPDPTNWSWVLRDRTNHAEQRIRMWSDVPNIIHDILKNGAQLAIVSRNKSKALTDRALLQFKATDPRDGKWKPILELVKFNEVYDANITVHFERIQAATNYNYADMILYDDDATSFLARVEKGVTFKVIRDEQGLTWSRYQEGLNLWRRVQAIRSPYLGQNLSSYASPLFIGYSGMDEVTVGLLTQGKNRVDLKESARWGYAMYVADDIKLANFFANWIKADAFGKNAKTYVCEIWARDAQKFLATNKVWFPERGSWMNNVQTESASKIAWDQENRDVQAGQWGAQPPYIMFSRHFWMDNMPIPRTRWNEMVVFAQIQDALILTIPLTEQQVNQKIAAGGRPVPFEAQITKWNIKVPAETYADFKQHNENIHA